MSQRPSACVPPPTDYGPKPRRPNTSKYRDRDTKNRMRGGGVNHRHQQITFRSDKAQEGTHLGAHQKVQPRDRFHREDNDDYFAKVQDDEVYDITDDQNQASDYRNRSEGEDGDDDPLDAYMKSLETETTSIDASKKLSPAQKDVSIDQDSSVADVDRAKGVRLDIEGTDDIEESYYKYFEDKKGQSDYQDDDERQDLIEYDRDGNILSVQKIKRDVEPLEKFDHSTVSYEPFVRCLYQEHEDISKLTPEQSDELRKKLEIKVSNNSAPRPVCSFAHFKFDEKLMRVIRRSEYYQPTPIQAQAIPAALSGRNIIGIAVTGSGKTAAYIWPMIVHIMRQPDLKQGDGPIGLVLVPTRELAQQVYSETKKFSNPFGINVVCAYGGGSKYEQGRDLGLGSEIVVATPGRLIDLVKSGMTNLRRVTYLVLDEADTFFKMGFEVQVRSICDHVRPDRQTLLFSATFKHEVEQLARTVTEDPVKIVQKTLGEANEDVNQHIVVLPTAKEKWGWLISRLVEFTSAGSVLIFVTRIVNCNELHENLKRYGKDTLLLHGDMDQVERNRVISAFKRKDGDIMLATDVAARGLDISHIRTVINYDVARDIDTHIHRVGRTGRAGLKGDAYTLLSSDKDKEFAGHLVKNLESSKQKVSDDIMRLAMQSHNFRKTRFRNLRDHTSRHESSSVTSDKSNQRAHQAHRSQSHHSYKSYSGNQNFGNSRSYGQESVRRSSSSNESSQAISGHRDQERCYEDGFSRHNSAERKRTKWR